MDIRCIKNPYLIGLSTIKTTVMIFSSISWHTKAIHCGWFYSCGFIEAKTRQIPDQKLNLAAILAKPMKRQTIRKKNSSQILR